MLLVQIQINSDITQIFHDITNQLKQYRVFFKQRIALTAFQKDMFKPSKTLQTNICFYFNLSVVNFPQLITDYICFGDNWPELRKSCY